MNDNVKAKYVEPLLFVIVLLVILVVAAFYANDQVRKELASANSIISSSLVIRDTIYKETMLKIGELDSIAEHSCVKPSHSKSLSIHDDENCESVYYGRKDMNFE